MPTDLETLMEMGFSENRSQRALAQTKYQGIAAAMDWLEAHEDDPTIDDEFIPPQGHTLADQGDAGAGVATSGDAEVAASKDEAPVQAKSLKCDECGKLLKSEDAAQMHAVRSGHSQFSESVEEIKPLTEEERQAQMLKAQELLKQKRLEREEKEKKEQLEREKQRRVHGKEMVQVKQKMQEDEMKKIVDERKREKDAEKLARQRVKEQIEKDKLDRAVKFGTGTQAAASESGALSPTSSTVQSTPANTPTQQQQPARVYDETNLQIRLLNGEAVVQKFKVTETLAAVRLFIHGHMTKGQMSGDLFGLTFATTFPRKVFSEDEMLMSLKQLGLVPSAALLLTKPQRPS